MKVPITSFSAGAWLSAALVTSTFCPLTKATAAPPPNDSCTGAIPLTTGAVYSLGTTEATSSGDPTPACQSNFGKGVWFTYVPPSSGLVLISTCGSSYDTVLQVFAGACAALTTIACSDDNGPGCAGVSASVYFKATGGHTYYILVGGYARASGNLNIRADLVEPLVTQAPQTQTAEVGTTVRLTVGVHATQPIAYQWFFNGANTLSGVTNSTLVLAHLRLQDAGAYTVVVSNLYGSVTSTPAMLSVIAAVDRRPVIGIRFKGEAGSLLNVACTESLAPGPAWLPSETLSLVSTSQLYFDVKSPPSPQRFYRAWQNGTSAVRPSMSMPFLVPAITLNGNVGGSIRLDCINQIGPTDAWWTLDTVTLTNTSQLYFDTSSIGQPARLWRIVPVP